MVTRSPSAADREPRADAPVVIADRFPATVTGPDGTVLRDARVVLTRDELFVWRADGVVPTVHGQPVLVTRTAWTLPGSTLERNQIWKIATEVGEWTAAKAGGCGCGNPLKAWVPWRPYRVGRL